MAQSLFLESAAPSTPAAGYVAVYAKTDGLIYAKDDAGAEVVLSSTNSVLLTGNQTIAGTKTFSADLINFTGTEASLLVNGIEALKFNSQGLITTPITVRQTVELGPVDTSGFASFGGSTGSTTVTASGTLYLNAANGMVNRRGSITNPSWTGASTNGTMYAYLDIAADGTCTTGVGTLAPVYQWGGTYSTTNGQFTFNIQEMTGKVGNGATAAQTYRVYVGEVTVAGGVVAASGITWYALNGRALVKQATLALGTAYNLTANIGTMLSSVTDRYLVCLTTEGGIAVGSKVPVELSASTTGSGYGSTCSITDRNTIKLYTGGTAIGSVANAGTTAHLTAANWSFECYVRRAW